MLDNIMRKLRQFMRGRYGGDSLQRLIMVVHLILLVVNLFMRSWIVFILLFMLSGVLVWRTLSRNISARSHENAVYTSLTHRIRRFFRLQFRKFRDRKTHVYRKCPKCQAEIRLPARPFPDAPRRKGVFKITCPRCKSGLSLKI